MSQEKGWIFRDRAVPPFLPFGAAGKNIEIFNEKLNIYSIEKNTCNDYKYCTRVANHCLDNLYNVNGLQFKS